MTITTTRSRTINVASVKAICDTIEAENGLQQDPRAIDGRPLRYIDQGKPGCLVAVILHRLGMPIAVLRSLDRERPLGAVTTSGVKIAESRHPWLRRLDPKARALLEYLQDVQDRGFSWRRAIREAFNPNPLRRLFTARRRPWLS